MSEALEMIRPGNTFTHEGVTGLKFTIQLPDVLACMLAGDIPLPLLRQLKNVTEDEVPEDVQREVAALREQQAFKVRMIQATVLEVNAHPVQLDDEDVAGLHPDDARDLFLIANRQMDPGGKG